MQQISTFALIIAENQDFVLVPNLMTNLLHHVTKLQNTKILPSQS